MPEISPARARKMLVGNLLGSKIIDADGRVLGHVADIQVSPQPPYEVQGLFYGERGWLHRFHVPANFPDEASGRRAACYVSWHFVERLEPGRVFLKPEKG